MTDTVLFLDVFPRHSNKMVDKGLNLLYKCAARCTQLASTQTCANVKKV